MTQNPFTTYGKQLRCVYDQTAEKWWFSVVDICAMLTGSDYKTARRYWNRLKSDRYKNQLTRKSCQLKMPGADGKYYFTDVIAFRDVIYLIQIIPSSKADPFKLWLAEIVDSSTKIENFLIDAGAKSVAEIEKYKNNAQGYVLLNVTKERVL